LSSLKSSKTKGKDDFVLKKEKGGATKVKAEPGTTGAVVGGKTAKAVLDLEALAFAQVLSLLRNQKNK
jgi:hypothetical protein